jgi:histidinol-phosphate aminotransferase
MVLGHDLGAMGAAIDATTSLVYVANPNNPTGTWNTLPDLRSFLDAVPPGVIVALDEAYHEYSRRVDCPDGMELLAQYPNLVVLRTFSKAHALAGVRVGYAVSHPEVADMLNRVRQPFNVNIPALVGAEAALGDDEQPRRAQQLVAAGLGQFESELPRLGLKVYPSAGNFVLADTGTDGKAVYEQLLRHGVIVRPMGGYGLPACLRITVGTPQQNQKLIGALAQVMQRA